MIRAQYAILAEFLRDGTNGKLDILGAFDRIAAKTLPAQHRNCVLAFLMVADTEDGLGKKIKMKVFLKTPSGQIVFEQHGELEMKPEGGTWLASARMVFEMNNLPITEYGRYWFILELDGKAVASHPLHVVKTLDGGKK